MLYYALIFLIVALVAGVLGFSGIAGISANIAWILFVVSLVLALVFWDVFETIVVPRPTPGWFRIGRYFIRSSWRAWRSASTPWISTAISPQATEASYTLQAAIRVPYYRRIPCLAAAWAPLTSP